MIHPSRLPLRFFARLVVVAFIAALGILLTPAGSAHAAGDDVTWSVRTASNDYGAERTSYSYTVAPGSAAEDALVVANHGSSALDLGVYAADGFTTDSGQFDLSTAKAKPKGVGAWVKGKTGTITVAAGKTVEVPFTVTVPPSTPPGDYAGGIVTSLVQPDDAEGINVDRRLGIRIALRVSGDLEPSLAVTSLHVDWDGGLNPFAGGDAKMTYTIRNTGNAVLSAQQEATVTGPFGWLPSDSEAIDRPPLLLPGESWKVSVPVHDVAAAVRLAASARVTPVVVDASGSTTALDPVTATAGGWAVPWTLVILVVVVVALVVVTIRLRGRRRRRQREKEDARVQEAVDRALGVADRRAPTR